MSYADMTCYFPDTTALSKRLEAPARALVLCFCAAWCDTCKEYQPKFEALSAKHPESCFIWIDIEDHPELIGDEEVENFPTVAIIQEGETRFMGTILPHIEHLDRLIQAMQASGGAQHTGLPEDLLNLLTGRSG